MADFVNILGVEGKYRRLVVGSEGEGLREHQEVSWLSNWPPGGIVHQAGKNLRGGRLGVREGRIKKSNLGMFSFR